MNTLSNRLQNLSPSATFAMSQKSAELKAQGIDIINMSVGEPDMNTPEHIKTAAGNAIKQNWSHYSPITGYADLRTAICGKLKRENNLDFNPSQIVVSNGAKQAITNTILTLINPGDEVIIPAPYWVSYPQMVKLAEGTPVSVDAPIEQDFKITAEQLERAITPRTKLIILCTPCNPTGSVYSPDALRAIAEVITRHENLFVISDEIYEHIHYSEMPVSIGTFPGMEDRTIVINGVSKAYAMTGWRIGFSASPLWIAKGINMLQGQYTSGPSSLSQKTALEAWNGDQQCVEDMRKVFQKRRDLIVRLTREIPGLEVNDPEGAFYLFPKCSSFLGKSYGGHIINTSTDLAMFLLEVGHVATVGGDAFGAPEYFRMSYATSDGNITEALRRIRETLAKLR